MAIDARIRQFQQHNFASNTKTLLETMPIVDRSKDLNGVDLRHDVLPVLNLLNKGGMFQNRQSTRTRIEKLKQTSSLFRLQKAAFADEF